VLARLACDSTGPGSAFQARLASQHARGTAGRQYTDRDLFLALCQTKAPGGLDGALGVHRLSLDQTDIRPWVKLMHACHASSKRRRRGSSARAHDVFSALGASGTLLKSAAPGAPRLTVDAARTCCNLFLACLKAGDDPRRDLEAAQGLVYVTMPTLGLDPDARPSTRCWPSLPSPSPGVSGPSRRRTRPRT